jgi:hypothetical protein
MIGSIIFLIVLGSIVFKLAYDHQLVKEREFEIILSNPILREYWNEAHNERNDGWTKKHYLDLYYETKAFNEAEKKGIEKPVFGKSATGKSRRKDAGK